MLANSGLRSGGYPLCRTRRLSPAQTGTPDLQLDTLATGEYARMHMLFEKRFFQFDVMTVDVRA